MEAADRLIGTPKLPSFSLTVCVALANDITGAASLSWTVSVSVVTLPSEAPVGVPSVSERVWFAVSN